MIIEYSWYSAAHERELSCEMMVNSVSEFNSFAYVQDQIGLPITKIKTTKVEGIANVLREMAYYENMLEV